MLMLLQIIATMQVFTEPFVITGGGAENAAVTVLYLIYKYAFLYDFGGACALSVMLLVLLGLFSAVYLRLSPLVGGGVLMSSGTRTLVSPLTLRPPRARPSTGPSSRPSSCSSRSPSSSRSTGWSPAR